MLEELKNDVCTANCELVRHGLVILSFGNVSGIDRERGLMVIKPSSVTYADLKTEHLVVLDLNGKLVEGDERPPLDAPTHLALYRAFPEIGGITHTHSSYATMFAQAVRSIPCLGTTHADVFYGEVPVTRPLGKKEFEQDYEGNTGKVIVERFSNLRPMELPGVLVAHHGPFTWGTTPAEAVENAIVLEEIAKTTFGTLLLDPEALPIPRHLLDKHYHRKHPEREQK